MNKKSIHRVACILLSACMATAGNGAIAAFSTQTVLAADVSYADLLFDQSYVHEINVEISEEDWADLCANASSKKKYQVTVTVDGETFENVSFNAKGNTSLSSVAMMDSDRYSFKINFGKYVDSQTYHGLKKLNLSNFYADATYMKDFLSYEIFKEAGVEAPLTSYVQLSINGEVFGLYLAIEDIGKSYLNRTNDGEGELYKPSTGIDNINEGPGDDFELPDGVEIETDENGNVTGDSPSSPGSSAQGAQEAAPDATTETASDNASGSASEPETAVWPEDSGESENESEGSAAPGNNTDSDASTQDEESTTETGTFPAVLNGGESPATEGNGETPNFNFGNFGDFGNSTSSGAALIYTDDELSSYSDIFDNAVTNVDEEDEERVVVALRNLSEGNVEEALDTQEVLRYFVAHNFVMNYDSYTGGMLHNYYLLEDDGKLSMLPWDYNLAFGTFSNMDQATPSTGQDGESDGQSQPGESSAQEQASSEEQATDQVQTSSEEQATDQVQTSFEEQATDQVQTSPQAGESDGSSQSSSEEANATGSTGATVTVNYGIDSPLSGAQEDQCPMWAWIVSDDTYLEEYHEVFDELISNYFESGRFEEQLQQIYELIRPYVEADPTAFYSVEEFDAAYEALVSFCQLRAQSIRKQLDGELSTITEEQNSEDRIDASDLDLSLTGGMNMGAGGPNNFTPR